MRRHWIDINWLLPALISSCLLAAAPSSAETYKWKDADGKVHYSDQPPPPNVKDEVIVKPPKQSAPATTDKAKPPAKAKSYTEQEADFKKRQVEAAEREAAEKKKADDAAQKKQNCEQAQAQLRSLQAGGRVTQTNANGEREYLSDAQIAQEIERSKKAVDSWCK
jgi:outer membrane biosynthesis protein TonB